MIVPAQAAGKIYAILGLGKTGIATAQALLQAGAEVLAWDDAEKARAAAGDLPLTDLHQADWLNVAALVMSPGIAPDHALAQRAKAAQVRVIGDIELLFQAQPKARYVGVTGTNGKSTTTALLGHILLAADYKAEIGGNLGTPVLALAPLGAEGIYVLELSSYQLELFAYNMLDVAVLLNITPDHLDRHGDMAGYIAAKSRIIRPQDPQIFICGADDEPTRALAAQYEGRPNITLRRISQSENAACAVYVQSRQLIDNIDGKNEAVLDLDTLDILVGAHNWQNIAASYAAARALGLVREVIVNGIRSFPGLAHRQQLIASLNGVKFVNDSKATNADATGKALACYDDIYLILGGKAKDGGLNGLESFMPRVRHAFLIGDAAPAFAQWLDGKANHTQCGTLENAVQEAAAMAWRDGKPGAVVLLSPACASFDQFASFEERGAMFGQYVRALTLPAKGNA